MSNLKNKRESSTQAENLPESVPILIAVAKEMLNRAYAPYSGYQVGAAVLTKDNRVYGGCNVENASYGLSICAERTAMAAAVVGGEKRIRIVTLYVEGDTAPMPCGACLQWMAELSDEGEDCEIVIGCGSGRIIRHHLHDLLPRPFRLKQNR